jgi:hypothetical protein
MHQARDARRDTTARPQDGAQGDAFGDLVQDNGHGQRQADAKWRRKLCGHNTPAIQRAMYGRSQN